MTQAMSDLSCALEDVSAELVSGVISYARARDAIRAVTLVTAEGLCHEMTSADHQLR